MGLWIRESLWRCPWNFWRWLEHGGDGATWGTLGSYVLSVQCWILKFRVLQFLARIEKKDCYRSGSPRGHWWSCWRWAHGIFCTFLCLLYVLRLLRSTVKCTAVLVTFVTWALSPLMHLMPPVSSKTWSPIWIVSSDSVLVAPVLVAICASILFCSSCSSDSWAIRSVMFINW